MSELDTLSSAATAPASLTDAADPYQREAQTFPHLAAGQVERAAAFGAVEDVPAGTLLFERGQRTVDFFIVLKGHIEIYEDGLDGAPSVFTIHRERQFTGELDLFNDRDILVGGRMGVDGRVARLSRPQFRRMLAAEPDIAEIIMRAFILRRVGLITHVQGGVTLIGSPRSADGLRLQRFLRRNGYPLRVLDPAGVEAAEVLSSFRDRRPADDAPVVLCGGDRMLVNPSNHELARCLGIAETIPAEVVFDVAVVGAGPAGLAAAVYAASEGLETLVLEAEAPGGQAGTSSKIENYLGFPTGISGQALAGRAQVQAQKFGARIAVPRRVVRLECERQPYTLHLDDGEAVRARTVVIATGARYRKLDVEGLERFEGSGVNYAATAVEAALCEDEEVVVVGGGNSAGQAAVYLSRHARHVHVLVRGPGLAATMSSYLIGRIEASDRITLHPHTEITALEGDRHLERVRWRDRGSGEEEQHAIANVFLMLGAAPNTEWLDGCGVRVDPNGFIEVGEAAAAGGSPGRPPRTLETSRPGVFAVGDVRAGSVKRVASSVGEGSIVVSAVHQALGEA